MNTINLEKGEVVLYNEDLNMSFKFKNLMIACKRAVAAGRTPQNGWNIKDDNGNTFEDEDWEFFGSLVEE